MNKTAVAQQAKISSVLHSSQGILQRKCACGNHTVAGGECAECAKNKSVLQRKLAIGASNDPLEQEADRVADQVLATPSHTAVSAAPPRIQRYAGQATEGLETAPASVDRVLASSGSPLEPLLRQDMEQRFGHDFSRVRVHPDHAAGESALEVDAQAYTADHHIVFGHGKFSPHSQDGRRLIAHELAHVIQQSRESASTTPKVLQRKAVTSPTHIDARLREPRPTSADEAAVVEQMSLDDRAESLAMPREPEPGVAILPAVDPPVTQAAPAPRPEPGAADAPAQVRPAGRPGTGAPTAGTPQVPAGAELETPRGDAASMPRLATMMDARRESGGAVESPGGIGPDAGASSDVEIVDLLGPLAASAQAARKTVGAHARAAQAAIERSATASSKKVEDQKKSADDKVRAVMSQRREQVDRTVRAHDQSILWAQKRCLDDAKTYSDNAKKAQTDGFAHYRGELVKQFDYWITKFDKLNVSKADWLRRYTEWNVNRMRRKYSLYKKRFINDIPQSEGRRAVQREAAYEVVEEYVKEFNKSNTEITPSIAKACENVKTEIVKSREEALREFDKGLPQVLEGIDQQRNAALPDIRKNVRESRELLAKGAAQIRARLDAVEEIALGRNNALYKRVDGQIESARAGARRQFERAVPEAMQPIAAIIDDAVGMLMNTDEELDPAGASLFVSEVVEFTAGAAEATGEVFAAARDTGIGTLAQASPFARRGFNAGKEDLKATLHTEGVDQETRLINFGEEAEKYVHGPLAKLDLTFQAGVEEAERRLIGIVAETREQLYEPMDKARKDIGDAVRQSIGQQSDAYWRLGRDMDKAARQAAWRYDHDILKYVVDAIEVILGFVLIVAILVAVVVTLVFIFGELIAAMIIGFAIGYFGAQAYQERINKEETPFSALVGAIADVTGFTDVKRAFTDPKMKPFDRGIAWGGFWLGLVGAGQGGAKFLKFIKVRLPKKFTNPFRLRRPKLPVTSETPGLHVVPEVPGAGAPRVPERIGFKTGQEPVPAPEVPGAGAPRVPERIGFKTGQEPVPAPEAPAPETSGASGAPQPRRAGFKLPHEKNVVAETPSKAAPEGEVVSSRLHHRKPAAPETPGAGKRRIGFVSSEEPAAPVARTGAPETPLPAGETPGGMITEMPRAHEMPGTRDPAAGAGHAPNRAATASAAESPRGHAGEAGPAEGPVKGKVVSSVEPEPRPTAPAEVRPSPVAEARLADERAIQTAKEQRIADQERVAKLEEELRFIEELRDAVGRKRERYIEEGFKKKSDELRDARQDLIKSRRAENEAEAAQRLHLLRDADVDPAAALHDPGLRLKAVRELEIRKARVAENDALIKANEADLATAKARVAERQKAFEATRPGSEAGKQSKALTEARDAARTNLESAQRHLEAVEERTRPAREANQTHYERMQQLDRDINPQNYPELSGAKGDFGEARMHDAMKNKDYEFRGSSKEPNMGKRSDKGLDGVYEKLAPAKDEPRHVVGEAKYDQAELRPGQEKWEWVDERLDRAVGPKHANRMRAEGYEYWVMKYNPRTKLVEPTKLWEFRPNGKFAPEQYPGADRKPLGAPHYEAPQL